MSVLHTGRIVKKLIIKLENALFLGSTACNVSGKLCAHIVALEFNIMGHVRKFDVPLSKLRSCGRLLCAK